MTPPPSQSPDESRAADEAPRPGADRVAPSRALRLHDREAFREHRRRRFRRRGRRAYIRSVYFLPSMATLGNAICGFAAIYVAALPTGGGQVGGDPLTDFFARHQYAAAAYLIFIAMIFDALDGRLARLTRHTTDFGGQLDSLADVISFGAAPAFLALALFKSAGPQEVPAEISRLIWAFGALYMSCAAMRLARFNVSNEHGEQHHFSFLGLPSPGAGGAVAGFILMHQHLAGFAPGSWQVRTADVLIYLLPAVVLMTGLLMVSGIRYPHLVNRYLRGKRSFARLVAVLSILLLLIVAHQVTVGAGTLLYALWGLTTWAWFAVLHRKPPART